jgi:hypothetical protein
MSTIKRTRIEPGIRQDAYGFEVRAFGGGKHAERRFPPTTPIGQMRRWQLQKSRELKGDARIEKEEARFIPRSPDGWCYIYFIRSGDVVKIGRATDPLARLRTLQTSHYEPIVLLAAVPGHALLEPAIHARFAHLRTQGEWFTLDDELARFINHVKKGYNPVAWLWDTAHAAMIETDELLGVTRDAEGRAILRA